MHVERHLLMEGSDGQEVLNPGAIAGEDGFGHLLPRVVRKPNFSRICHTIVKDGKVVQKIEPLLNPEKSYEKVGLEDSRITKIGNTYNLTCTAFDGITPRIELFQGNSIFDLKREGIVSPCITLGDAIKCVEDSPYYKSSLEELAKLHSKSLPVPNKDGVLFPEKIDGYYIMLQRIPNRIQLIKFQSPKDFSDSDYCETIFRDIEKHDLIGPKPGSMKVGAGAPPIKVGDKWLLLFHEVTPNDKKFVYTTEAALLDSDLKLIERTKEPLFKPEYSWEKIGTVNNVVFLTGAVPREDRIVGYYGGADRVIGCANITYKCLSELLPSLPKEQFIEIKA
jgi:predicted GH43/DUF377 family glycosyl hydrolase